MLDAKGRDRNAIGVLARSKKCNGKGGPFMRPDNSQIRGHEAGPGLAAVASRLAAQDDPVPVGGRAGRLGVALAGLAQELAAARREIAVLKRENVALRSGLDRGPPEGVRARRIDRDRFTDPGYELAIGARETRRAPSGRECT